MEKIVKYNGFYQELYEIIGNEKLVNEIHRLFYGDTVKLPKYLYNSDYVVNLVSKETDIKLRRKIAKSYGYSYDTITKKLRNQRKVVHWWKVNIVTKGVTSTKGNVFSIPKRDKEIKDDKDWNF